MVSRCRPGSGQFSAEWSIDHPEDLEGARILALETYWRSKNGWPTARIEEELVVTATGCEVVTKFPAKELLVAGQRRFSEGGPVNGLRESHSHFNTPAVASCWSCSVLS